MITAKRPTLRFLSNMAYTLGVAFLMAALVLGAVSSPAQATTANTTNWDKSSLSFSGSCVGNCEVVKAYICNTGDRDMQGPTTYSVYWAASGNPKSGSSIVTSTVPALAKGACTWLTYNPANNPNGASGNYMFKALQRPGHPGQGELWSGQCSIDVCSVDEPTSTPTATATSTDVPTATPTETEIPTATATSTDVPTATPTETEVPTATATSTEVPTMTPTATVTETPEVPEITPTATNTPEDPIETPVTGPTETPVTPDPTNTPVTPDPTKTPATPDPTKTPEVPQVTVTAETPEPTEVVPTLPPPAVKLTQPVLIPVTGADNTGADLTLSLIQKLLIYLGAGLLGAGLVLSGVSSKFMGK